MTVRRSFPAVWIVDRYVLHEVFAPFLLGVGVFVVILVGDILYTLAELLATRQVSAGVVLRLLAYKLPAILVITFPVSTLLGVLLGLGRLVKDNELQAMRLSGISLARLFLPVVVFGAFMTGVTLVINELVSPWANHRANTLIRRAAFGAALPQIREQIFFRGPDDRVFYIGAADDPQRALRNVMVFEGSTPFPKLITADTAEWEDRRWVMHDGVIREFDEQGFSRYEAGFTDLEITVGLPAGAFHAGQKTPEEMTARELRHYLSLFGHGDAAARFSVEYHRKFAIPFASLIFAALAAPLSVRTAQGGRLVGIGLSIALLFAYYVMMSVGRAMGIVGTLAPYLSAWMPNLVFVLSAGLVWSLEEGWLRSGKHLLRPAGHAA